MHELTYGDFQRHDSPTMRLVKQKDEQLAHKTIMSKKIPTQKNQLFYTCGVEKSYLVQQKDKLDYERANKKPLEFMEKFDAREVVHKKVKQGGRTGSYTYSETTRS